jgi:hypothetical protein
LYGDSLVTLLLWMDNLLLFLERRGEDFLFTADDGFSLDFKQIERVCLVWWRLVALKLEIELSLLFI